MKICKCLLLVVLFFYHLTAYASNLLEVYRQAQAYDPVFQKAIAQRMATKAGVPISLSALLPNISLTANPSVARVGLTGTSFTSPLLNPRNNTQRAYTMTLTLSQTVFNFAQFYNLTSQVALSKGADATLNAALQDLMIRVSKAYFTILKDEDNVRYSEQSKTAYAKQLDQVKAQYKARIRTITDLYTAQASYDTAYSSYEAAKNTLENDRDVLLGITGVYYSNLSHLSTQFPLISPQPQNVEKWIQQAFTQNWFVKAKQYNVESARQIIKQQFAGHLPTISLQGTVSRQYNDNINGYHAVNNPEGPGTTSERAIGLNINVPIFSGGGVSAQTDQAMYNYQVAQQESEQTIQTVLTTTRQSYHSILSGIIQVTSDKHAVTSNERSLKGMEISFKVGIETLIDLLNQQQKLYQAQIQYANDRYTYLINLLTLKQAAGTLSLEDLRMLNIWLIE